MAFSNIKWIFFDMGHTLLDEDEVHIARLEELNEELGGTLPPAEELLDEMVEFGTKGARSPFGSVAKKYGSKRHYPYNPALEVPFPETEEALRKLSAKYKLGIIANQRGGSAHRLQAHGLMKYIDFVYSSEEMGRSKPAPDLFLSALDTLGCAPGEACMVGDRIDNDIRPAKRIGMKTVRLRKGFFRNRAPECEYDIPDADIESISDLPAVFGL
ncbi:MAG: HAD family hydrolase [Clostridia bacterium]|nr:HAD family hydrolase [Clostridia bacterium]